MMIKQTGSNVNQSLRQLKDSAAMSPAAMTQAKLDKLAKVKSENENRYTLETHEKKAIENNKEKFKTADVDKVKPNSAEDIKIAAELRRLKMWEEHVKQHERPHQLVGGEVSMYIPAGSAPTDPSPQDIKTAATKSLCFVSKAASP